MVGSLERIFRRVLRDNAKKIGGKLLCPICKSMTNPKDEISALNNFFSEMQKLEKSPLSMKIPDNLRNDYRFFEGNVILEPFKTHKRTAKFSVSESSKQIGAETSDIVLLVTHECISPNAKTLVVDEKISFFQAKIEKKNRLFKIQSRQWYLMRYWPKFSYKKKEFNLPSCRRVPDICSFYLLILKRSTFNDSIFYDRDRISNCRINSLSVSTPFMEERMPKLRTLSDDELAKKKEISLRLQQEDGDGFFNLLWHLLLTHLGVHDFCGVALMNKMFPETPKENNPKPREEFEEKPSIGVRIRVQLKTEGFPTIS